MQLISQATKLATKLRRFNLNVWRARHDRTPELAAHLLLGQAGERHAVALLQRKGYRLVATNVHLPVGRSRRGAEVKAEIDIIAYDEATLCFIEVKTRRSDEFALPEANVDVRKQRQITRAARVYRRLLGLTGATYRYDVVSVLLPSLEPNAQPTRIELLRSFWTDAKFRKRHWIGYTNYD